MMSGGETRLDVLLQSMSPELADGEFVFLSFENNRYGDHLELEPVASVLEPEGLTLVVQRQLAAKYKFPYAGIFRQITLSVHSSLIAVGLTAACSAKLAEKGISANMLAGFYHDHLFVPNEDAHRAVAALNEFATDG